jgi:CDP-diglyceride synthetase
MTTVHNPKRPTATWKLWFGAAGGAVAAVAIAILAGYYGSQAEPAGAALSTVRLITSWVLRILLLAVILGLGWKLIRRERESKH